MGTKYSASLDVGEELDDKPKRKPIVDDSEPEAEHSLEDDFNELIRRELADEPTKTTREKEITITPAYEVPKVAPVETGNDKARGAAAGDAKASKDVKPAKSEPRVVKAEQKPVEPKPRQKSEPKASEKPRTTPKQVAVKAQPKKVETKPEPAKVERHEPSAAPAPSVPGPRDAPAGQAPRSGRWFAVLLVLLIAAGAVYAVNALRNGKDAGAQGCVAAYIQDHEGVSIAWQDANTVERFWLRNAYESGSPAEAAQIFHMLACPEAFISTLSDPASYESCKAPATYVLVDAVTLDENPIAALDADSVLARLAAADTLASFKLVYKLEDPHVRAWQVV